MRFRHQYVDGSRGHITKGLMRRRERNHSILFWAGQTQRTESSFRSQFLGDDKQEDEGARKVCPLRGSRKWGDAAWERDDPDPVSKYAKGSPGTLEAATVARRHREADADATEEGLLDSRSYQALKVTYTRGRNADTRMRREKASGPTPTSTWDQHWAAPGRTPPVLLCGHKHMSPPPSMGALSRLWPHLRQPGNRASLLSTSPPIPSALVMHNESFPAAWEKPAWGSRHTPGKRTASKPPCTAPSPGPLLWKGALSGPLTLPHWRPQLPEFSLALHTSVFYNSFCLSLSPLSPHHETP